MIDTDTLSLIAQFIIALALFVATFWYAYHTMRLAKQQEKMYRLNRKIWVESHTPRIWFSLTRVDPTKICLTVSNLGGDVAKNIEAKIKTDIVTFLWTWPSMLPNDKVNIDLPDSISYIQNLKDLKCIEIQFQYLDTNFKKYTKQEKIDTCMMDKGMQSSMQR